MADQKKLLVVTVNGLHVAARSLRAAKWAARQMLAAVTANPLGPSVAPTVWPAPGRLYWAEGEGALYGYLSRRTMEERPDSPDAVIRPA